MPQWSEEARAAAKELFSLGLAATDAASAFSQRFGPVTRNAMCGLWFRMGLSRNDPRAAKARRTRAYSDIIKNRGDASRSLTQRIQKFARPAPGPVLAREYQIESGAWPEPIAATPQDGDPEQCRCNIFSLTNRTCRWPIGDVGTPEFFFCGSPQANLKAGIPYCPQHERDARA